MVTPSVSTFDLASIAVPFRMQPGLSRLAPGAPQLTRLVAGSELHAEKRAAWQAGVSRHAQPGFDPAPALAAIAAQAARDGAAPADPDTPLELAYEEDFAVLDGDSGALPWLCVCAPSRWAPEDKLGLSFAAVHAPVADNASLLAAARQLVRLATGGERWERHVWTISPSPFFDQHPRRRARARWPATDDVHAFAQGCWLRFERQTFFPVAGAHQAVFTIRVGLEPLVAAVARTGQARRLHDSLASMSEAVLAYKGLATARPPLLRWLAERMT